MSADLAATITKAASRQTYYTIRFLVDRKRVADAYRAYAYFRWVDDVLDAGPGSGCGAAKRAERLRFLNRQQSLLDACLNGERPETACPEEAILVDLVRRSKPADQDLQGYLRQMMRVMAFDAQRRGRLITRQELDDYTNSLAIAVTSAMHHFIGHGSCDSPDDVDRNRAATGAHLVHMLRDTDADVRNGYFNVPREVLEASSIGPGDTRCDAYRTWVRERVRQADRDLRAGAAYFARVQSRRHRLAGLAYIARFRWLIGRIEHDGYQLRPSYADAAGLATGLRMATFILTSMAARRRTAAARPARIAGQGARS